MSLNKIQYQQLVYFFNRSHFAEEGAVITDLDGTAIHEFQGKYSIPQEIELGLKKIYDLGRPVVINTLRFPLSVMRTFGKEWYAISKRPVPTVLMNGSLLGYITQEEEGRFNYDEIAAFPLTTREINDVLKIVGDLIADKVNDLLVFYYPRNWQKGEIIWTPVAEKINVVQQKYMSASTVFSGPVSLLQDELMKKDICMIFLLIDIPQDKLMAYQHTKRSNFFTHAGVNKQSGTEEIAKRLDFSLSHSIGAGDSEMDTFLIAVGQAVHVGNENLKYQGILPPIKLQRSQDLGELLLELAEMQKTLIN
ncbi:MAG: HAD hydrolase family protein [Chitinophagaceae bacterium]